ncbi:MAG TPA: Spy/CpxP family protein refolding chaperone [Syntrophobacteraceae bacterium]|nr:Spy/CpxP family protein refolding chaperone [Syntrophobacteraceae bacterium]
MKKLLTVFAIIFVAAVWMTGSWLFFDTLAVGAQGPGGPPSVDVDKAAAKDETGDKKHCGDQQGHRHGKGSRIHRFLEKLNLSGAQKQQVKAIVTEERAKMKPLLQQLKAGRDQLDILRKSGTFDEAKVRSVAKGQADTLSDLIVIRERMRSGIWALLTPEQRAKGEQMRESWKARREKGPKKEG